jgi:hypothetical protein
MLMGTAIRKGVRKAFNSMLHPEWSYRKCQRGERLL